MENERSWIAGDGGPLIVLQASAVSQWQGADDFDNSLMNGGDMETDYDVICGCDGPDGPPYVIHRYGRDMLVLDDSEWAARLCVLDSGAVAMVQSYYQDDQLPDILERVLEAKPSRSFDLAILDDTIRLQVGADNGTADTYGYQEVAIAPADKHVDVYNFEDSLAIVLSSPWMKVM